MYYTYAYDASIYEYGQSELIIYKAISCCGAPNIVPTMLTIIYIYTQTHIIIYVYGQINIIHKYTRTRVYVRECVRERALVYDMYSI